MTIVEPRPETESTDLPDSLLLEFARMGDASSFAHLRERHQRCLHAGLRSLAHSNTEDVVAETFTQIWEQLQNGRGPVDNFYAYAITVGRNIAARWYRENKRQNNVNVYAISEAPSHELAIDYEDKSEIATAFASLPERWQQILWMAEIQDRPRGEIAETLSMTPNAVSQLLRRAKEGLSEAWLVQQLPRLTPHPEYSSVLPRYVRGTLPRARSRQIKSHVAECAECTAIVAELKESNRFLGAASMVGLITTGAGTAAATLLSGAAGAGSVTAATTMGILPWLLEPFKKLGNIVRANMLAAAGVATAVVAAGALTFAPGAFNITDTSVAKAAGGQTPATAPAPIASGADEFGPAKATADSEVSTAESEGDVVPSVPVQSAAAESSHAEEPVLVRIEAEEWLAPQLSVATRAAEAPKKNPNAATKGPKKPDPGQGKDKSAPPVEDAPGDDAGEESGGSSPIEDELNQPVEGDLLPAEVLDALAAEGIDASGFGYRVPDAVEGLAKEAGDGDAITEVRFSLFETEHITITNLDDAEPTPVVVKRDANGNVVYSKDGADLTGQQVMLYLIDTEHSAWYSASWEIGNISGAFTNN